MNEENQKLIDKIILEKEMYPYIDIPSVYFIAYTTTNPNREVARWLGKNFKINVNYSIFYDSDFMSRLILTNIEIFIECYKKNMLNEYINEIVSELPIHMEYVDMNQPDSLAYKALGAILAAKRKNLMPPGHKLIINGENGKEYIFAN